MNFSEAHPEHDCLSPTHHNLCHNVLSYASSTDRKSGLFWGARVILASDDSPDVIQWC